MVKGERGADGHRSLLEDDVLAGDIYGLISPYATANFWVSPSNPCGPFANEN